jgi:hypothetical protein
MTSRSRRQFLSRSLSGAACLGLTDLVFLHRLPHVAAEDATIDPSQVRADTGVDAVVRLIEETRRDQVLEVIARRVQKGLTYRELVTALFLAGIQNIRPHSGNNFHAVLVIRSAYDAGLAATERDRWLPIFWAIDEFKRAQDQESFHLDPIDEASVPQAHKARQALHDAVAKEDRAALEAAAVGCVRAGALDPLLDLFAVFGSRDFGSLGHPAIFVSQAWRAVEIIGRQNAESVFRSLSRVVFPGFGAPPLWQTNRERAEKLPALREGAPDSDATIDLLAIMRQGTEGEVSRKVAELLTNETSPQTIWDAAFAGAGELLMRQPAQPENWFKGIFSLHAVTSMNALRYAYKTARQPETRRFLLLQSPAIVPMFLNSMRQRGGDVGTERIDEFEPAQFESAPNDALAEIFADVGPKRMQAARKALAFLADDGAPRQLIDAARQLIFLKAADTHDYKFSTAVFEDIASISPAWRNRFLASCLHIFRGTGDNDNRLIARTREALQG